MVYDCFQFFNELDILKLRMHVLNDVVDKFVISESGFFSDAVGFFLNR